MKARFILSFAGAAVMALVACTSTTTSNGAAPAAGSGPPIAADQVGSACSGVGTSDGDTATFKQADCPGGLCVADARTNFDTYCTADCEGRTCPDGFTCAEIKFGDTKHACLKDGSTAATDAGKDSSRGSADAGPIGTKTTKGVKSVDTNFSSHGSYTCTETCTLAGGACDAASCQNNGCGWVEVKYNDGSGTFGNQISSCSEPQDYASGNVTMTAMSCFCDGLTVPTTVRVTKSEGLFACATVCASWSLGCSADRKSYAYTDATGSGGSALACSGVPTSATDHYVCACDP